MNFGFDEFSLPQISDAVTDAIEQAQGYLEADDLQPARLAIQQAEAQASTTDEYGVIAGVILSDLGDEEWGRRVLNNAIERASSATGLATLSSHALQIGDMDLAHMIIRSAVERATSTSDAVGAAAIAEVFGGDPSLTDGFHEKAKALAVTSNDFITMARGTVLMDPDRARHYLQQALDRATDKADREIVAQAVEEVIDDGQWAGRIRNEMLA